MLKLHFTVDVEIWPGEWSHLDQRFAEAFKAYVYGPTSGGDCGLPLKLKILNDHGLTGVFFVEPLFAARFGKAPLEEVVGLIREAGQEIQLHLHTEWADEADQPLVPGQTGKRQFLFMYSQQEQARLIAIGKDLLGASGAPGVTAFRAGSFGMNKHTIAALAENGITIDSSYNHTKFGPKSGLSNGELLVQPIHVDGVYECPMTVYQDRPNHYRHLQLGACSFAEVEQVLTTALEKGWQSVVMLSHNFELLNQRHNRVDPIVLSRFRKLARFLERHSDEVQTAGFRELTPTVTPVQPEPIRVASRAVLTRYGEQLWRRLYR